jgi:hypothetical protein
MEDHLAEARPFQASLVRLAQQVIDGAVKPRMNDDKKTRAFYDKAVSEQAALRAQLQSRGDAYDRAIGMPRIAENSAMRAFEIESRALKLDWETLRTEQARAAWLAFLADRRPAFAVEDPARSVFSKYIV